MAEINQCYVDADAVYARPKTKIRSPGTGQKTRAAQVYGGEDVIPEASRPILGAKSDRKTINSGPISITYDPSKITGRRK